MIKRRIAYSCPFVPAEWIAAHGLIPWRVLPGGGGVDSVIEQRQGVCAYCRSFVDAVQMDGEIGGVVLATSCDQMRRLFDVVKQVRGDEVFLLNVPATWQSATAREIYADDLRRMGEWLCGRGGQEPSDEDLIETMKDYQLRRRKLLNNRTNLSGAEFSRRAAGLYCGAEESQYGQGESLDGAGLAVIGGPLMKDDFAVLEMIESRGGRIVLDATETGERGLCGEFDMDRPGDDPFDEMVRVYFEGIVDAWRRPDEKLFDWFAEECRLRSVRGIILKRYVWCDIWHGQLYRLREMFDGPVLEVDTGELSVLEDKRIMGRIDAFLEAVL